MKAVIRLETNTTQSMNVKFKLKPVLSSMDDVKERRRSTIPFTVYGGSSSAASPLEDIVLVEAKEEERR